MGVPGLVLAVLASRLREVDRRPPPAIADTVREWWRHGMHGVTHYVMPFAICAGAGALLAGLLALFEGIPSQILTAVFSIGVSAGIAWTVWRLVPLAVRRTTEAGAVAPGALDGLLDSAPLVPWAPGFVSLFLRGATSGLAGGGGNDTGPACAQGRRQV